MTNPPFDKPNCSTLHVCNGGGGDRDKPMFLFVAASAAAVWGMTTRGGKKHTPEDFSQKVKPIRMLHQHYAARPTQYELNECVIL